ncbi:unnamed protein product, partial [Didymodactylos carnosus]
QIAETIVPGEGDELIELDKVRLRLGRNRIIFILFGFEGNYRLTALRLNDGTKFAAPKQT